jgi:murein DD-endopeptidase MepM/ murein hydrolase activator NlpD
VGADATTVAAPRRGRAVRWLRAPLWCTTLAFLPIACDPAGSESIERSYWPRSAHQAYGHSLAQARLTQSALGREWLAAAEHALASPITVEPGFAAEGVFAPGTAAAWGYRITSRAGQRLTAVVRVTAVERVEVFVDLFRLEGGSSVHVASAAALPATKVEPQEQRIEWQVLEPTDYIVRVQPELLRAGTVHVAIRAEPLLAFPVTGLDTHAIQSGFGAERDGGAREHRGVDIFAARGTDAVAAVDGWVTRVDSTRRGGNVVWLTPLFGDLRLYYAHLDTQLVEAGQFVRRGEVIGTVGNTGNAVTTPPHLHFGVYVRRRGGATDPVSFLRSWQ